MILEELNFMGWNYCEKNFVRKVSIDKNRINSLLKSSSKDLVKAREENDGSYAVERYYESIKKVLTALLLNSGLKSSNHQCLISYLYKKNPNKENECRMILRLAYLRNRLSYYGEEIPEKFLEENKREIEKIIKWIFSLLGEK